MRKWFKRWLGEAMSARWPRDAGAPWWAEGGSVKWVWERAYFENVFGYLERTGTVRLSAMRGMNGRG